MIEYTLKMNSSQTRTCLKAVELLMRLKLNQYKEIPFALINLGDEDFGEKRDAAEPHLKAAFDEIYRTRNRRVISDTEWKDDEWYRLYNLYQAMRYQLHNAENPTGSGVDSYPPMRFTVEPIPECTFERKDEKK